MLKANIITGLPEFLQQADTWDQLWKRSNSVVANKQAALIALNVRAFHKPESFAAVVVRDAEAIVGAFAFQIENHRWLGRTAVSLGNPYSIQSSFLTDVRSQPQEIIHELLKCLRRNKIDAIVVDWAQLNDANHAELEKYATQQNRGFWKKQRFEVGLIHVPKSPANLDTQISKNHAKKIRRWKNHLSQIGPLNWIAIDSSDPSRVSEGLETALEIEHQSWKGTAATSMLSDPHTATFWRNWATALAARDQLRLFMLRCGDRAVAFDLGYLVNRVYTSVKISYLDELREMGVGHVRDWFLLQHLIDTETADAIDTLGPINEATRKWPHSTYPVGKFTLSTGSWQSKAAVQVLSGLSQVKSYMSQFSSNAPSN